MKPYFKPILLTAFLLLILLFIVAKSPVRAGAAHFPTFEEVQQMIANALSPIQSSIQGISNRLSNLEATITPIPSEIAGVQATLTPIPGEIAGILTHQTQTDQSIANLQQGQSNITSQYNDLSKRVSDLEQNATHSAKAISFFTGLSSGQYYNPNQESSIIDVKGYQFMVLDAHWIDDNAYGGGSYNLWYSDDQVNWTQQDSLSGNAYNLAYIQRTFLIKGKYYKVILSGKFNGILTGFAD